MPLSLRQSETRSKNLATCRWFHHRLVQRVREYCVRNLPTGRVWRPHPEQPSEHAD